MTESTAETVAPISEMWAKRDQFAAVLPKSVDVEAFLGTAAAALYADEKKPGQNTPTLMEAATKFPVSLIVTLLKCAALGHMPGTDEYYLHVRKGKVAGTEGYRGVVERMYRSGAVRKVIVREVCAKDKFRYIEGVDDKPIHSSGGDGGTGADFFGANGTRDRGPMVGVYAYAELATGATSRIVLLNRDDVMAARDASDAGDSEYSPWNRLDAGPDHPELRGRSMWLKTGAKRLEPWVPTSAEYRRQQLHATAAAGALPAGRRAELDAAPARPEHVPAKAIAAAHDDGWVDKAIERAAALKSEHAGSKLWAEAVEKVNVGELSRDDYDKIKELIGAQIEYLRQQAFDKAMSALSENESWRAKIEELTSGDDADTALRELDEMADKQRAGRIRHAITTLAILRRWNTTDTDREAA
jgi:recombination protein RecT